MVYAPDWTIDLDPPADDEGDSDDGSNEEDSDD